VNCNSSHLIAGLTRTSRNFKNDFRGVGPNWVTLPGHFKDNGYLTLGTGKLYHEDLPPNGDDVQSWSNLTIQFSCNNSGGGGAKTYCDPDMLKCKGVVNPAAPNPRWCVVNKTWPAVSNTAGGDNFENEDIAMYRDAMKKLHFAAQNRNRTGQPFFLGCGLRKPHLDWRVPQSLLELYTPYNQSGQPLAKHGTIQQGRPAVSYHGPWRSEGERKQWEGWG
jgi:iduronate 2-sulfatase